MKDLLYAALGGAILLKERVEEEVEKLEEQGKLSKKEGEEFIERLKAKGEESEESFKAQIKDAIKEVMDELGIATKADIEALRNELK